MVKRWEVKFLKGESLTLKPTVKKLGDAQKHIDVARVTGISTKESLCFDHPINNKLFEVDVTVKPEKK